MNLRVDNEFGTGYHQVHLQTASLPWKASSEHSSENKECDVWSQWEECASVMNSSCSLVAPGSWLLGGAQCQVREPSVPPGTSASAAQSTSPLAGQGAHQDSPDWGLEGPSVTGVVRPVVKCLMCTGSLSQDLTCDLSSGRHNLSFLQGSSTKLSSLTQRVRQTWVAIPYWQLQSSRLRARGITSLVFP